MKAILTTLSQLAFIAFCALLIWHACNQAPTEPYQSNNEALPVYTVSEAIDNASALYGQTITIIGTLRNPSFLAAAGRYDLCDATTGTCLPVVCWQPPLPQNTTVKLIARMRVLSSDAQSINILLIQRSAESYDESAQFYQPL